MNPWIYSANELNLANTLNNESLFTRANGYLGIRGYPEEGISHAESDPMQFVAGYFDCSPVTRNTMVNLPTVKRIRLHLEGEALDMGLGEVCEYQQTLNMHNAVSERSFTWHSPEGRISKICFSSYLSYARRHVYLTDISIQPVNWSGKIQVEDIFDATGLTIGQTHYDVTEHGNINNGHSLEICTRTSKLKAILSSTYETSLPEKSIAWSESTIEHGCAHRKMTFSANKNKTVSLRRYTVVATDFDSDAGKRPLAQRTQSYLNQALRVGWAGLREEQDAAWRNLWEQADVRIEGDPKREFKLRFSIFQMLQAYRSGDSRISIGAKFLSGDHYSGHYFWDTDNFLTPFYLFTMPQAAQDLLTYRVRNLQGARIKARSMNFPGAFYPWEACSLDGQENCPEWWKDKALLEPTYIPCGKIELHINSAVAFASANYRNISGRNKPARQEIDLMLIEMARFWAGRGEWENGSFSIKNVIGPDEYHEYVDDNAYTNHTAKWTIQTAIDIVISSTNSQALKVSKQELSTWKKIVANIALGYTQGIIAQDRTFLQLPEIDRSKFQPVVPLFRQISIEEIGHLQAIKQADVLALFHLMPFEYDFALMHRCWNYYEPRTFHDSNLSAGSHAVAAAVLRRSTDFLAYYDKVLNLDIGGESYNVTEGLHAANAGNAWNATIMGAAGIRWTPDALCCAPQMLENWTSLEFSLIYRGRKLAFQMTHKTLTITCAKGRSIQMIIAGRRIKIDTKEQIIRTSLEPMAVVFDLDGVLVDSAKCHFQSWKVIADELGVIFDEKKNDRLRGVSRRESLMILLEGQPELDETKIQECLERKNQIYQQMVETVGEELLLPGVKPFLTRLKVAGLKLAVASSSKNTPALLRQSGLDQYYFDAVADGNDIQNSKPHPEVFLLAAKRLGISPTRCICVEDAEAGIESGRQAGMKTLGVGPADLGGCDWRRYSIEATSPEEIFGFFAEMDTKI